ncbi:hypothetical protein NFI96_010852 [Prochilodus magdalenae]|nr:hypothetical protein NFI96_010852 [Prochilodus magdalenae]
MRCVSGWLCALLVLLVCGVEERAEACSCSPVHPQQAFCNADIGAVLPLTIQSVHGNYFNKVGNYFNKMFKGPDRDIDVIFTAPSSAVCGVTMETNGKKEYLISGKADGSGKMHVTLCDLIMPWESMSATQKKSLSQRYQMGCDCKISRCAAFPCIVSTPEECLWTDWVTEKIIHGRQSDHYACIKRGDGSCAWYRGSAPPKKEFLDNEDP